MAVSHENERFEQLARRVEPGGRLLRAWPLTGGVSAQVTALEVGLPGGTTRKVVVRQHGEADLARNPNIAADEFKLLQVLKSHGLPVPAPLFVERAGQFFSTPCIVLEYIEGDLPSGTADWEEISVQMAAHLAGIHAISGSDSALSFLPGQKSLVAGKLKHRPSRLDESIDEGRIRDALEAAWPWPVYNKPVLLHGDFWPGNTLWRDGYLTGIIDWEDASVGDPVADLANSRLEILWAFGVEAMSAFTERYLALNPVDTTSLPYWDLYAALRPAFKLAEWAADQAAERKMREGHAFFVTQAFERLPARHSR